MKKFASLLLVSIFLIFGCVSAAEKRSLQDLPDYGFSVKIPEGWWKPQYIDKFLITKDGPYLQYVLIQQRPLAKPFTVTKKTIRKQMLPQEAASIIIDELASDRNLVNFKLIENAPAVISGQPGFKILFTYFNENGSEFKTLYYGLINGTFFFNLRYTAAKRHYFEKDLADFDQILSSFKLVEETS